MKLCCFLSRLQTMEERWGVNPFVGYRALESSAATDDPTPCPADPKALLYFRDFQDPPGSESMIWEYSRSIAGMIGKPIRT
jgi:hypothetical protein